jgi:hypothetical protein
MKITARIDPKDIQGLTDEIKQDFTDQLNKLARDVYREIKLQTPVRTGELQRNWTLAGVFRELEGDVSIFNHTHYVNYVNYGTTTQAGQYFVEQATMRVLGAVPK